MRKIKIFIGSSIVELSNERKDLVCFISELNNKYVDKGIYIEPYICEEKSSEVRTEGSQKQHNDYIENEADATVFMFYTKAGQYTVEELKKAKQALDDKKRPRIFTYFKTNGTEPENTEDMKNAVDMIEKEFRHYYKTFSNADTIKIELLKYFVDELDDGSKISVVDGKINLNNYEVKDISLDNIFAYQNNEDYNRLKEEISDLEQRIKSAVDSKDFKSVTKLSDERNDKIKLLNDLENSILDMLNDLYDELKKDNANQTVIQAYRLLELGKLEEAKALVSFEEIKNGADSVIKKKEIQEQLLKDEAQTVIDKAKVRIKALEMDTTNPDRFNEIEKVYNEAVIVAEQFVIELGLIYDYASFLDEQNKTIKAYEIAKKLKELHSLYPSIVDDYKKSCLYNFLGNLCSDLYTKVFDAEKYYLEAIGTGEKLAAENPERFNPDLAMIYNNAGVFYKNQGDSEKAEKYCLEAIEIREKLATENPERFNPDLAMSYNNAGVFYKNQGDSEKAEKYFLETIEIYEKLAAENSERFNPDLAMSYNNAGVFYNDQGNSMKAEKYYHEAIEIYEKLAAESPERFNPYLADSYNNTGVFYNDQGDSEKAEKYCLEVIEVREKLAAENPERFNPDLAMSYNNAGVFYDEQGAAEKAEGYYHQAIEIYEKLVAENPERFNPDLAMSYNFAGVFYDEQGAAEKAGEYYLEAIKIWEEFAKENPERFNPDLAISYYNYGLLKNDDSLLKKAYEIAKPYPQNPYCRRIIEDFEN